MVPSKLLTQTTKFVALLAIATLALAIIVPIERSARIITGGTFVIISPGLIWSFIIFRDSSHGRDTNWILRLILAIGLSMALVPLVILIGYGLGIKITTTAIIFETALLHLLGLGILAFEKFRLK